ncbi:MAG: HlyD family efflux transporter periplasmic adaptor subunit [Myxococcota bacterium]
MMLRWLCIVALLCAVACGSPRDDGQWVQVERGTLVVDIDVTGTLAAVDSNTIGPPGLAGVWNYKIAMMAPEGTEIEKDAPVLGFDTSELQRRLEEKTTERDSAAKQLAMSQSSARVAEQDNRLALAEAEAELRKARLKAEAPPEITAVLELDKARLDLELAEKKVAYQRRKSQSSQRAQQSDIDRWRSQRDRAEERVAEIDSAIKKMIVPSPRGGTVIYETNWQGEKKKVGDNAWRAETVMQVVSLEEMEARGEIDEVDASRVSEGQVVSLRLDAQADTEVRGRVRQITNTVQRQSPENPLKVVHLKIALEDTEGRRLRPGMRFRGKVETARVEDALLVPLEAIAATPEGPVAFRRRGDEVEAVSVTLGRRNGEQVEVLEGLEEGDEIEAAPAGARAEAAS